MDPFSNLALKAAMEAADLGQEIEKVSGLLKDHLEVAVVDVSPT